MYSIDPYVLAQMIAAHTCGHPEAIAEQDDLDLAHVLIAMIDNRYDEGY